MNSLPPTDPLALGQHLVRELGLAESTDTLARWLAHEIADGMTAVAEAKTARRRATARREVLQLITTLWERREDLPRGAYPLAPLREILGAISLFTEYGSRAWWGYRRGDDTEATIFREFTRLMPCLLLLHAPHLLEAPGPGTAAYEHLDPEERAILNAIDDWMDGRTPPRIAESAISPVVIVREDESWHTDDGAEESPGHDQRSDNPETSLRAAALDAVATLEKALSTLRSRLEAAVPGSAAEPPEAAPRIT